ncbi:MAG: monovalent cation/H+ antiporter subunit D family protein [Hyphomicrobium sp.]|uniref:monovalent cation/H+ antiporter subunit D family protein n=1 Tax=Hyphomicrobium sp. CS1BSMeth3 TaxID=1892844 RepID=UPI000AFEB2E5|nr:monovalent cation/H+ antiporter subunit D family protein [Hyphomicrobium sp. CS1BSMeth3]MBN9262111.1 monovalent cation/H+ antiporter subunit D family protein [Hyphomicrobium sp.]
MSAITAQLPGLQVVVPLLGAIIAAFMRRGTLAWAWATLITAFTPIIAFALLFQVWSNGPISYHMGGWPPPIGIEYRVDLLNAFVLVLVSLVSTIMMPYARRSVAHEIDGDKQAWFYAMYLLCLAGLLGIAITGDAFNAFVFLEISSLSTYVMIAMGRDRRALVASYQYLILGTIGATFYVIGVGLLYLVTGSLNFADIAARLGEASAAFPRPVLAGLAFLFVGISLKLALFPLHLWLPNAYAYAPSFATAFLAATATKVAVYLFLRIAFSIYGVALDLKALPVSTVLYPLSIAAMFIASILAVYEQNLKRMLAYSSVAQIGYITLGIALMNQAGLTGGIVHLFNHALIKGALFLALGAVMYRAGTVKLDDLGGIGRTMPLTFAAFVLAGMSLMGVPGTAGFISKYYLIVGALDAGKWPVAFLIVASSLIALLYIGRAVEVAYFRPVSKAVAHAKDPPLMMLVPMLALTFASVYFGIDTELSAGVASRIAELLIGGLK